MAHLTLLHIRRAYVDTAQVLDLFELSQLVSFPTTLKDSNLIKRGALTSSLSVLRQWYSRCAKLGSTSMRYLKCLSFLLPFRSRAASIEARSSCLIQVPYFFSFQPAMYLTAVRGPLVLQGI